MFYTMYDGVCCGYLQLYRQLPVRDTRLFITNISCKLVLRENTCVSDALDHISAQVLVIL